MGCNTESNARYCHAASSSVAWKTEAAIVWVARASRGNAGRPGRPRMPCTCTRLSVTGVTGAAGPAGVTARSLSADRSSLLAAQKHSARKSGAISQLCQLAVLPCCRGTASVDGDASEAPGAREALMQSFRISDKDEARERSILELAAVPLARCFRTETPQPRNGHWLLRRERQSTSLLVSSSSVSPKSMLLLLSFDWIWGVKLWDFDCNQAQHASAADCNTMKSHKRPELCPSLSSTASLGTWRGAGTRFVAVNL